VAFGSWCVADEPVKLSRKPNIVLLLIDDLGWSDVSCNGQKLWQTPYIDRLASEGMLFTDACGDSLR
jgi:arylsulfatase A-like enzyme